MAEWRKFKEEDFFWRQIVELLEDRERLVLDTLRSKDRTVDLIAVRELQQELLDIHNFKNIPDAFIDIPDKPKVEDDGVATSG